MILDKNRLQRGFTLVELSIVIIIVSLLMASGLAVGTSMVQQANYIDTQKQLAQIRQSLHDYYIVNGRLPCAARLDLLPSNASFATEAPNCTTAGISGTYRRGSPLVRIGMVPARTLGLTDRAASDAYGNRILYVVTEGLTDATNFSTNTGGITIRDGSTMTGNTITSSAAYTLISPGADRKGAFAFATAGLSNACAAGNLDTQNCDLGDELFRDAAFNSGSVAAKFFDDIVDWAPKFHFMALDTESNALWSSNVDHIYATGTDGSLTTGNVGIGTANPADTLHVNGRIRVTATDSFFLNMQNPAAPASLQRWSLIDANSTGTLSFRSRNPDWTYKSTLLSMRHDNDNVGIGTDNPYGPLHVRGTFDFASLGKLHGYPPGASDHRNMAMTVENTNPTDGGGIAIIITDDNNDEKAIEVWNRATSDSVFQIQANGRVVSPATYTTNTSNAANMYVHTNGLFYRSTSSRRFKKDIQDYIGGLDKLDLLRPVTFYSTSEEDKRLHAGFIAEEVEEAGLSEFVSYDEEGKPDGIHYSHMTALLAKAMQELKDENAVLKERIAQLEASPQNEDNPMGSTPEKSMYILVVIALLLAVGSMIMQLRRRRL